MSGSVIVSLIVLCQVVASLIFCWRARKVKEISWLPKFIMALAAIDGIMTSSYYISAVFFKKPFPSTVLFWMAAIQSITYPTIMGLLIRFERVQVQLRAQEENTIKILGVIKRANILQVVFILTLVLSQICFALGIFGTKLFSFTPKAVKVIYFTGKTFDICFECLLSFSMMSVNKYLALFF